MNITREIFKSRTRLKPQPDVGSEISSQKPVSIERYDFSQIRTKLAFLLAEFSGSLGDLGLFIPLVVAMAIAGNLNIGVILIFAGVMNIVSGIVFKQPIPVQPMKAIAVVCIIEGLSASELAASGMMMGILMLIMAFSGAADKTARLFPRSIVRGLQLGIGIKLALKGIIWIGQLPLIGINSILTAFIIAALIVVLIRIHRPIFALLFIAGFGILWLDNPNIFGNIAISLPAIHLILPVGQDWFTALYKGVLPQFPLTLLNSVIAVCALSADYFPKKGISPRHMATSVGLMNLLCVPFGGIPMCHGSGGLGLLKNPFTNRATTVREWLSLSTDRLLTRAALIILRSEAFSTAPDWRLNTVSAHGQV